MSDELSGQQHYQFPTRKHDGQQHSRFTAWEYHITNVLKHKVVPFIVKGSLVCVGMVNALFYFVIILGLLMHNPFRRAENKNTDLKLHKLVLKIKEFHATTGALPADPSVLATSINGNQAYLETDDLYDVWGNKLSFEIGHTNTMFCVSPGPDGHIATDDDRRIEVTL